MRDFEDEWMEACQEGLVDYQDWLEIALKDSREAHKATLRVYSTLIDETNKRVQEATERLQQKTREKQI